MPNLVITTYCNRSCPYCFALEAMEDAPAREMNLREIVTVADMMIAGKRPSIGVLGGEPTLHPQFQEIVWYLLARGMRVRVFTNALCSAQVMQAIAALPDRRKLTFVVNVNFPEIESAENHARQERFIARFREICDVGLNIYRADLDPLFLADLIERTDLRDRRVRVGFAQPIAGEGNEFLSLDHYRGVADQIVKLAEAVFPRGMRVGLDCGFPLCSFTDENLGRLRRVNADLKFVCDTATDIAPAGHAWSCFPLAKQNRMRIDRHTGLREMEKTFVDRNNAARDRLRTGVFEECDACVYRSQRLCHGGCIAHVITDGNGDHNAATG